MWRIEGFGNKQAQWFCILIICCQIFLILGHGWRSMFSVPFAYTDRVQQEYQELVWIFFGHICFKKGSVWDAHICTCVFKNELVDSFNNESVINWVTIESEADAKNLTFPSWH